MELSSERL